MQIIDISNEPGGKPRYNPGGADTDYAGNLFVAASWTHGVGPQFARRAAVWKLAPDGTITLLDERDLDLGATADGATCTVSGANLHVFPAGHIGDPRAALFHYVLTGVCVPYPEGRPQKGAPGAYVPPEGGGGSGLTDADKAWIQEQMDGLLDAVLRAFGGDSRNVRAALQGKAEDGQLHLMMPLPNPPDPNDPKPRIYQDALFQFVKNAAANPWANVLNGGDEWGQQQQDALKAIIREVLAEPR